MEIFWERSPLDISESRLHRQIQPSCEIHRVFSEIISKYQYYIMKTYIY